MRTSVGAICTAFLAAALLAACSKTSQTTSSSQVTANPAGTAPAAVATQGTVSPQATASAEATESPSPAASPTIDVSFTDIRGLPAEQAIVAEAKLGVFDTTTGAFRPSAPITRGEFVKWLVKANNAYYADTPGEQIRPATAGQYFADVPPSHPDYPYIQALAYAGFVVGIDQNHFAPDRNLTREEMIAIKVGRDLKGDPYKNEGLGDVREVYPFADVEKISKRYYDAVYGDDFDGSKNVPRIFGALKFFYPQRQVTRAEAALAIDKIGNYSPRTAEQVAAGATP